MSTRRPSRTAVLITAAALGGFLLWTALVVSDRLGGLDEATLSRPLTPNSPAAQIAAAVSIALWPGVVYAGLAVAGGWAYRRRLRNLAAALWLVIPLAWGGAWATKVLTRQPRPAAALDVITSLGYAYPSSHVVAVTVALVMVTAMMVVTRQRRDTARGWRIGAVVILVLICLDRWLLNAHWLSDIVGALLWGVTAAALALIVTGVTVLPPRLGSRPSPEVERHTRRRCAVIYNPTKVGDLPTFQRHVEYELSTRGWDRAIWLETSVDDPGREMTRIAVRKRVDLVIGAGGDGTTRVICAGLAGTGIPFGLVPAGTGNLLAKNLGIPLDEQLALDVAFNGTDVPTDLVRLEANGHSDHFAVMAGIGIDAVIMAGTNPELKKAVGSAAYFVSAARNANHPPVQTTIVIDGGEPLRRRASVIVLGNVGFLQAGIQLIPGASATDGRLDLMVASPRTARDWARLTAKVLARQRGTDTQLDRLEGRRIDITLEGPEPYQMDGDTVGACQHMVAEVQPGALTLRMPR